MSDNRQTDKLILEKLDKIETTLSGENGICVRVGKLETKTDSIQTEVREHKANHKDWLSVLLGIIAVAVAVMKKL